MPPRVPNHPIEDSYKHAHNYYIVLSVDDCHIQDSADDPAEGEPLVDIARLLTTLEIEWGLGGSKEMDKVRAAVNRLALRPGLEVLIITDTDDGPQYTAGSVITEIVPFRGGVLIDVNGDGTPAVGVGYSEVRVVPTVEEGE